MKSPESLRGKKCLSCPFFQNKDECIPWTVTHNLHYNYMEWKIFHTNSESCSIIKIWLLKTCKSFFALFHTNSESYSTIKIWLLKTSLPYSEAQNSMFWKVKAAITELDSSSFKTSLPALWNSRHGTACWRLKSEIKHCKVLKAISNSQLNSLKIYIIVHPHMSTNWCSRTIGQKKIIYFFLFWSWHFLLQLYKMSNTLKSVNIALVL